MQTVVASDFFKNRKDSIKLTKCPISSLLPASRLRRGDIVSITGDVFWVCAKVVQMLAKSCPIGSSVHVFDSSLKFSVILKDTVYVPIFNSFHLSSELSNLCLFAPTDFLVLFILSDGCYQPIDLEIVKSLNCAIITNSAIPQHAFSLFVSGARVTAVSRNRDKKYAHLEI